MDHELADRAVSRLRMLGVQITETGSQACASPVGRVMAYSKAKASAIVDILTVEKKSLGDNLRAIVIADFEKSAAMHATIEGVLDPEAGGAIAAFRAILSNTETDELDPILVTGSTVFVDDDLLPTFMNCAEQWLTARNINIQMTSTNEEGFFLVTASGADWCPRVYVEMITELFQKGITRCLVGTRGLLGEGWDANRVNVLIDLTTVTTSMTVNQLRGRSIRIDPLWPQKIANNWDVICVADEFTKGLDDYHRFNKKHSTLYGVTDDGAVEKGVGHVHPAFTEMKPEGIHETMEALNEEMLRRASDRNSSRILWKIGEPFNAAGTPAVEIKQEGSGGGGFPPFGFSAEKWSDHSLAIAIGSAIIMTLIETGMVSKKAVLKISERSGNYTRAFLKGCSAEDSKIFIECLEEALGPLDRPRYVIQRHVDHVSETWLSGILPKIIGKYFRRRNRVFCMLHAVPSPLAKHKDTVAIYKRHWNSHVSPGEAYYAHQGEGKMILSLAIDAGQVPQQSTIHKKDIFL